MQAPENDLILLALTALVIILLLGARIRFQRLNLHRIGRATTPANEGEQIEEELIKNMWHR